MLEYIDSTMALLRTVERQAMTSQRLHLARRHDEGYDADQRALATLERAQSRAFDEATAKRMRLVYYRARSRVTYRGPMRRITTDPRDKVAAIMAEVERTMLRTAVEALL